MGQEFVVVEVDVVVAVVVELAELVVVPQHQHS